jgi:uncharacterized protein YdeI (YjbR/CyaY-like superfamily)
VKSTDPRIDAYIAKAAPFARPVLRHLRGLIHEACPGAEETIKWGSPSFTYGGQILCFMAAFKAHCAFGFWHREMRKLFPGDEAASADARGSLGRITALADLPSDRAIKGYVRQAAKWNESDVPAQPRPARGRSAELPVPDDLAAALKRNKAAGKSFQGFPPGQRKEYVLWITGAKRTETRQKRLATAIEWLAEGKKLNWRYEKC